MFASVPLRFTMAYDLWPFLLKGKGTDANIHHVGALWKALIILVWIMGLESKTASNQIQPAANQFAPPGRHCLHTRLWALFQHISSRKGTV